MKSLVKDVVCFAVAVRGGCCHQVTNYFRMLHSVSRPLHNIYIAAWKGAHLFA